VDGQGLVALARDAIRRSGMLLGGEAVLVAVSGGADSVALLDVLGALSADLRLTLHVVHVHHGLRAQADADAEQIARAVMQLALYDLPDDYFAEFVPRVERVTVRALLRSMAMLNTRTMPQNTRA